MIAWIRKTIDLIARLLTETDTSIGEFWGSTMLVAMGSWLIVPFHPDTFEAIPVYRLLSSIMPEWAWGLATIAFGFGQAGANLGRNRAARRLAAFAAAVFFAFLFFFAILALSASLLVPLFGTASFVEGIIFLHLRKTVGPLPRGGYGRA